MTKTQRRRSARAARHALGAGAPLDHATAAKLVDNHSQWPWLCEAGRGLVEIEFTSPFIDTELLCPERAHLIVHLDPLRGRVNTTRHNHRDTHSALDLQRRVAQALDAVVTLCLTAKRLSPWTDLHHRFWEQVCASDALLTPLQASSIEKWVRYTKFRGIPLLLSWSYEPFDPGQLMEPLRVFLATPQPAGCKGMDVPVTVGLRFVQADITTSVLERLSELLIKPTENPDALLIDPASLRTLWFHSNPLYAPELSVLASILADQKARRIDELKLENFIVEDAPGVALPAFSIALSQVFAAAVAAKSPHDDAALSLSLAENTLSVEHLDAFQHALAQATRPLCALSFSKLYNITHETWKSLSDLIFQPLPTATPHAVLDLSGVSYHEEISLNVGSLVRGFINSLWSRGVAVDENVECCFSGATLYASPGDVDRFRNVDVLPHTFYKIEGYFAPTSSLLTTVQSLSDSGETESVTGWVSAIRATQLRVDGSDVVATSFARVIYDYPGPYGWTAYYTAIELTSSIGSRLKALSIREHHSTTGRSYLTATISEILGGCPCLEELSLQGAPLSALVSPPIGDTLWDKLVCALPASIRVLDISHCGLRDVSLQGLEAFPLQYLSLLSNPIGLLGVESLLAMLRKSKQLQLVELNPQFSEPSSLCIGIRSQIDETLGRDYLHVRDKAAVLSVLAHIQRQDPRQAYPGDGVVALVFAFAGTRPRQAVKWTY